jgi:hypothetical protein
VLLERIYYRKSKIQNKLEMYLCRDFGDISENDHILRPDNYRILEHLVTAVIGPIGSY